MKSLFTKLVLFSQAGRGGQAAELWSTIPSTEAKKIQSAVQLPAEKPWQQSAAAASPSRFRDALLTGSDELPRQRRNKNSINQSPGNSNMLKYEPGWTYSWGGAATETQAPSIRARDTPSIFTWLPVRVFPLTGLWLWRGRGGYSDGQMLAMAGKQTHLHLHTHPDSRDTDVKPTQRSS